MWADVKSYISAFSSFKNSCSKKTKKNMLSGVDIKINFFSASDTDAEGIMKTCSSQPSFLLPKLGLVVHILIKNIPLYYRSDSCDLNMEIGKSYLIVLPCALGSVQSC